MEMDNLKRLLDNLMHELSDLGDADLTREEFNESWDDIISNMMLLRNISEREREEQFIRNLFSEFFEEEDTRNFEDVEDVRVTLSDGEFSKIRGSTDKRSTEGKCAICLGEDPTDITLQCSHSFHTNCIKKWLTEYKVTCPICRMDTRAFSSESTFSSTGASGEST